MAQKIVDMELTRVTELRDGFARKTLTPGRNAKRYWQIIRRAVNKVKGTNGKFYRRITVECIMDGPVEVVCKGNGRWLCYHTMMALMTAAAHKRKRITLFQPSDLDKAERYKNLMGGRVYQCASHQSGQIVYAVMWEKKK
jgi:hypothetical protein